MGDTTEELKGDSTKNLGRPACSALPPVAYLEDDRPRSLGRKPSVPRLSKDRDGPAFTDGWMERAYMDSVPEGFKVVGSNEGRNFY
jgi:hypothetical protein